MCFLYHFDKKKQNFFSNRTRKKLFRSAYHKKYRNSFFCPVAQKFLLVFLSNRDKKTFFSKKQAIIFCLIRLLNGIGNTFLIVTNRVQVIKLSALYGFPAIVLSPNAHVKAAINTIQNIVKLSRPVENVINATQTHKRNFVNLQIEDGTDNVNTKRVKIDSMYQSSKVHVPGVRFFI
jgi:hypothetical protein